MNNKKFHTQIPAQNLEFLFTVALTVGLVLICGQFPVCLTALALSVKSTETYNFTNTRNKPMLTSLVLFV